MVLGDSACVVVVMSASATQRGGEEGEVFHGENSWHEMNNDSPGIVAVGGGDL